MITLFSSSQLKYTLHVLMASWALQVLALEPLVEGHSQMATVRLKRSDQTVSVRCKDLGERWEAAGASGGAPAGRAVDGRGGEQDRGRKESKKEKKREKESKRDRVDSRPSEKSKVRVCMGLQLRGVVCTGEAPPGARLLLDAVA